MKKVVINTCFGGFSISREAAEYMESLGDLQARIELDNWRKEKELYDYHINHGHFPEGTDPKATQFLEISIKYKSGPTFYGYGYGAGYDAGYQRDSPTLIAAVEKLGEAANGPHSSLSVVEIPDDVDWFIHEYDGNEHIAEKHRTWS